MWWFVSIWFLYTVKVKLFLWLRNITMRFKITSNNQNLKTRYPTRFMLLNSKPSVFKANPLLKYVSSHRSRNVKYKNIVINLNQKNTGKLPKVFHSMLKYFWNSKKYTIEIPSVHCTVPTASSTGRNCLHCSRGAGAGATIIQLLHMRHCIMCSSSAKN